MHFAESVFVGLCLIIQCFQMHMYKQITFMLSVLFAFYKFEKYWMHGG